MAMNAALARNLRQGKRSGQKPTQQAQVRSEPDLSEAVELEPELEPPVQASPSDPPENFLALYFREMAPLPVLQPEQEFAAARQIESQELKLWQHLLENAPLVELFCAVVERGLEEEVAELPGLRRVAKRLRETASETTRARYRELCSAFARKLHVLDVDRRLLFAAMVELSAFARGERARAVAAPGVARTKAFAGYYRDARRMFAASQRARNEFVKSNLRLVVSIARRFNHGRMPLSDLIQEGNIGLIKAVERYDYRRGYRFSTYASWWIRHSISRALADKGRAVRLPVHMLDAYHKVTRTGRELASKLGRQATAEEIGYSAGIPLDKVEKIQGYLLDQSVSLDRAISDDDDRRFIELLQDPDAAVPTDKLMDQSVSAQVQEILGDLRPIEADVLRKRFGLDGDGRELTLKEIGDSYKLSRERIRQIQEQALLKIRRALQRRNVI
jgi:RNA polymerase primary sigma factor